MANAFNDAAQFTNRDRCKEERCLVQAAEGREAKACTTPRLLNKMLNNAMAIGVRVEPELERQQAGSTHWSEQVPDWTDWMA